jgi:hypothetical protein
VQEILVASALIVLKLHHARFRLNIEIAIPFVNVIALTSLLDEKSV